MMRSVAGAVLLFGLVPTVGLPAWADTEKTVDVPQRSVLKVAGISANSGENDPRILYILPWQAPSLPRRARAELNQKIPELTQSVSGTAVENHRLFRETLNPLVLEPTDVSSAQIKP
ncbi:hypothetical protein [Marinobacter sp.]|uniref:hypothetical protein n=1 Tax=Marinobacter sp. TaxID=50741 RepID=UPI002B27AA44|nr:hypothetical protein [Marinobacter sp.]